MAEAQAVKPPTVATLGTARIFGRIGCTPRRVTGTEGVTYYHLLRLPAPDAFTSPQTVEVRSEERLGEVDQELSIVVRLGGYSRTYETKGEHGERGMTVRTAQNTLTFVAFA